MTLDVRMKRSSRLPRSVRSRITSIAAVIAMVAAGAVLTAPAAAAGPLPPAVATFVQNGIEYTLGGPGPATVKATGYDSGGNSSHPSLTIPGTVTDSGKTYKVVAIADSAFNGYNLTEAERLTDVVIGNNVKAIGKSAFYSNRLASVTIPNSVTAIGDRAFENNPDLTSVVFTGKAPTVTLASDSYPSFDASSGSLVLTYPLRFDASRVPGGYTWPTWHGYHTKTTTASVSFDANGHGSAPAAKDVVVGTKVSEPAALSASGYTFTGWFTNKSATKKFSFNTAVSKDLTLYAGWEKVEKPGNGNGNGSPAVCHPFPDVNASNVHCRNIEWLAGQDITKPADGKYHPGNKVTRGSMAAFMQRIAVGHPAPKCTSKPFNDVAVGSTFCKPISWMANNGITFGVGDGSNYGTTQIVNRQSMASFLHRIYDYMH